MRRGKAFPTWSASDGSNREPSDQQLLDLQADREAWAAGQVVGWEKRGLAKEDYDFRSWTSSVPTGVKNGHFGLRLGAFYEYARETTKFRALLVLANPKRKRQLWEHGPIRFAGLDEDDARHALFEMFDALARLAKPLAKNIAFADIWKCDRQLVEKVIHDGIFWRNLRVHHGVTTTCIMSRRSAVELAKSKKLAQATTFETVAWGGKESDDGQKSTDVPARVIDDGKEVIALQVDWANYRDKHLEEQFGVLIKRLRQTKTGVDKVPPQPEPEKEGKKSLIIDKYLNCLRTARVLDYCHGQSPQTAWKMLGLRMDNVINAEANSYRDAKRFHAEFTEVFPFNDGPVHVKTPKHNLRKV
jgi:hypothetical protein